MIMKQFSLQTGEYNKDAFEAVGALHPADVVEVVRCKDCRHLKKDISFCPKQASYIHDGEWFCADGERKNKGEK